MCFVFRFPQVRQLLDLWVKQGRISGDTARPVHQQMSGYERQMQATSQLSSIGIPPGLPVQRVILTAHEEPLDLQGGPEDRMLLARDGPPEAEAAGAGGQQGAGGGGGANGAPGSPSEEGLLAALVDEVEEGEVVQPPEQPPAQQQQDAPQPPKQQPPQPQHFRNLFGPRTVRGYVMKQYSPLDHLCQPPLVSVIAQHLGKQAAAAAAAAAAAKQSSGSRAQGLLAVLQQRGLELRWSAEVLSARNEEWLLDDHEQVCVLHTAG